MGTMDEALKALAGKEGKVNISDLTKDTGSTEDTLRKQLSTLKTRGYVDGNTKEGWIITSEGRAALERKEKIPLTAKDVGADSESKLKYYMALVGITPDTILATVELIMNGDPENLEHVWKCMTDMDVPIAERRKCFTLWRNYLNQKVPPGLREKVPAAGEEHGEGTEEGSPGSSEGTGRDYIILDDIPVFVGHGQGDYPLKDAKDIVGMRSIRARLGTSSGGGGQQWGPKELSDLFNLIDTKRGDGVAAKIYAIEQTEQGAALKEVKPGEPVNLNPPGGGKTQPLLIIDNEGIVQELKPGLRIGSKPESGNPPPQKVTVVRQTDKGLVKETFDAGETIILGNAPQSGGGGAGLPFPVFDSEGKPVVDSQGRPVYANLESTLKVLGWREDQRRADQRHEAIMGLVQTARENVGDGIAALREAAAELKGGSKTAAPTEQVYQCSNCQAQFKVPSGDWQNVGCPNCKTIYTREQVMGA